SRSLHENGLKHKGNIERHLSDVHKREAEKRKEDAKLAKVLGDIDRKVGLAPGQLHSMQPSKPSATTAKKRDYGAVTAAATFSAQSTSYTPPPPPVKIDETTGLGQWSVVEPEPVPEVAVSTATSEERREKEDLSTSSGTSANNQSEQPSKHAHLDHEQVYEEDVDSERVAEFKISEKRAASNDEVDETVTFKKKKKKSVM
ncbi:hypothetical protein HDU99_003254, partial [Rhizoclosmatium hyalinum]